MKNTTLASSRAALLTIIAVISIFAGTAMSQTEAELKESLAKAVTLIQQNRAGEALPHLALLIKARPEDSTLRFMYGVALLTRSKQIGDSDESRNLSAEALVQFKTAKKLGNDAPEIDQFIKLLGGSSDSGATVPANAPPASEADKIMEQAEVLFAQSKYDDALALYQKALALDPKMYNAALYSGDVYVAKSDWENAEKSYQRAISIDPFRETAYRYSATPLMKQKKYDQARDRYIEAFITEPYSQLSPRGISQWADATGADLRHPKIEFPKIDDAGPKTETKPVDTALRSPWDLYSAVRGEWKRSKFAASYPAEKTYRHSLKEETEAIRAVLSFAKEKKIEDKQLQILQAIENEGLLESYVLLARPDRGIAADHPAYLKDNRPRLRQYFIKYVIQK